MGLYNLSIFLFNPTDLCDVFYTLFIPCFLNIFHVQYCTIVA